MLKKKQTNKQKKDQIKTENTHTPVRNRQILTTESSAAAGF